ncbi:MAG TPA: TatD family hydrolase [Dehalococcoidales bacterium]|nr:TatD family hydrolase [Dehalococcoidales bacterium]
MSLNLVDTHAHLDMPEFDTDREEVIKRAVESDLKYIITIGINPESNNRAIALAEKYPRVLAGVGFHPQESKKIVEEDIQGLIQIATHPKVVLVGEMGLDFFHQHSPRQEQMQVLQWQLKAARTIGKPVVIHSRQAQAEILPILTEWRQSLNLAAGRPPGVLHCFNLDAAAVQPYLEMGFFLSIGAYSGYPSAAKLRETIKVLPSDRLLIETDCPYLPPQKMRGLRNEPAYSVFTASVLAEVKGLSLAEMARLTTANAQKVFNLPD